MFSNKYNRDYFRVIVCGLLSCLLLLTGCRFGDDNNLASLAKKTRTLNYYTSVSLPTLSYSEETVQDLGERGLNLNWGREAELAVLADEFVTLKDSTGEIIEPRAVRLVYDYYHDATLKNSDNPAVLDFSFQVKAKHGFGEDYATQMQIVYPYRLVVDGEGEPCSAYCDSLAMDFTGQDGKLSTVREKYFVALGQARAVSSKDDVQLYDVRDGDSVSKEIQLQPKVAIVRFSLIVPAQREFTLLEFLHGLNMTQQGYYIERITLTNRHAEARGISKVWLDLADGWMQPQRNAVPHLTLTDAGLFWNQEEIQQEEAEPLDNALNSWGTAFYVAFPCTDEGTLPLDLLLSVNLRLTGTSGEQDLHLYGTFQPAVLEEGGYYITSPVRLTQTIEEGTVLAHICKVP